MWPHSIFFSTEDGTYEDVKDIANILEHLRDGIDYKLVETAGWGWGILCKTYNTYIDFTDVMLTSMIHDDCFEYFRDHFEEHRDSAKFTEKFVGQGHMKIKELSTGEKRYFYTNYWDYQEYEQVNDIEDSDEE